MPPPSSTLRIEEVSASYGGRRALTGINLTAGAGELVYVTGPSGAGKTTLLRLINGELAPEAGRLCVAGIAVTGRRRAKRVRRHVGVVFQDYGLVASMTAAENVEFAYRVTHVWESARATRARALAALAGVGLGDRGRAFPHQLSGGEQQRVAIARALVSDPALLLADEPTGNLDRRNARQVLTLLEAAAAGGKLVIVATHDPTLIRGARSRYQLEGGRLVALPRARARAS